MEEKLKRIAIITGATSGIGEATARRFVAKGFGVVGNGRTASKLESLEKELGEDFLGVAGDASSPEVIESLFVAAQKRFGADPDIVVANAGVGLGGSAKDADLTKLEKIWALNVNGALTLIQKAAQRMVPRQEKCFPEKAADIVVIGSVVGKHVSPYSVVYGSTKFAVHSLAEGLRREVGPKGVRVSLVAPGIVISGFQDGAGYSDELVAKFHEQLDPILDGDDIAEAIEHLISLPPHVNVSEIVVRCTRQDYP